ncbi:MAG: tagaturonate reductase [Clostridia bacterium]|nr:tagaturonate reductase [Clostridia bacterium]
MKHIKEMEKQQRPVRIIQFGGGVFLRGFFDWMVQRSNNAGVYNGNVMIVRSKTRGTDPLAAQNFNYTMVLRDGSHEEKCLVDCIAGSVAAEEAYEDFLALADNPNVEVIVSNTTEAGLVYEYSHRPTDQCPKSYPAKLTALLYRRYQKSGNGLLILPLELIENNGTVLRDTVLRHAGDWGLEQGFTDWVTEQCSFRNTLVDRIVSGTVPAGSVELPYMDEMINTGEYFHLFVVDGKEDARLPFAAAGINIKWVESVAPYRTIKVRILNGAHTSMIPYALLLGVETVRECLENDTVRAHLEACLEEIITSMSVDEDEARQYAAQVLERFANPFIHHRCAAIALHSADKFVVRVLPSILEYRQKVGKNPEHLLFSLAMLVLYLQKYGDGDTLSPVALQGRTVADILSDTTLWGRSLAEFAGEVTAYADTFGR